MPLQPKLLDYTNTQFLFIGHSSSELEKATESQPKAHESKKDACLEEMENLEHEDELRVKHLKGSWLTSLLDVTFAKNNSKGTIRCLST